MMIPDVNILICAFRRDAVDHARHKKWWDEVVNGVEPFGSVDLVLSAFARIVTNPRIFKQPTSIDDALQFAQGVRGASNCVNVEPGPRHWETFCGLCQKTGARGNLVADAYLAALAIESGSEWITMDGDFARFPGLRWRRPF